MPEMLRGPLLQRSRRLLSPIEITTQRVTAGLSAGLSFLPQGSSVEWGYALHNSVSGSYAGASGSGQHLSHTKHRTAIVRRNAAFWCHGRDSQRRVVNRLRVTAKLSTTEVYG